MPMTILVRPEDTEDFSQIREVNIAAFGTEEEADLVEALRKAVVPLISLVAVVDEKVIGHILFSPVTISPVCPKRKLSGWRPCRSCRALRNRGSAACPSGMDLPIVGNTATMP